MSTQKRETTIAGRTEHDDPDRDTREAVDQRTREAVARSAWRGVGRYLQVEAENGGTDR